jgi:hypothetical protein
MLVFNDRHFMRHISMPTLREFTQQHQINPRLNVNWEAAADTLHALIGQNLDQLEEALSQGELDVEERKALEHDLMLWHDDLRRAHCMSNAQAVQEFRSICAGDPMALTAFENRTEREIALWMLAFRDKAFRDAELHLAFQAKSNGKFWKKHLIPAGLTLSNEREKLEQFCDEVTKLYKKVGAGKSSHVEVSERTKDSSVQVTIYVEGPVTAIAHFEQSNFTRVTTRIALETALVYHPKLGIVESIVKGGAKNHAAVLQLFGEHVLGQKIEPEEIQKKAFRLNALRDGMLSPCVDWSEFGVEKVRLRRAKFSPIGKAGVAVHVEATPEMDKPDAAQEALDTLKISHSFEADYSLDSATLIVYMKPDAKGKYPHFSFGVQSFGSSTIKNLSDKNQSIAQAVLKALGVIEADDAPDDFDADELMVA